MPATGDKVTNKTDADSGLREEVCLGRSAPGEQERREEASGVSSRVQRMSLRSGPLNRFTIVINGIMQS